MTLIDSWHESVFRNYVLIIGGMLLFAGLALSVLQFVLRKNVSGIWQTYKSWLFMAPLILVAVGSGRIVTILFIYAIALLAFKEFARATGLYRDWWMTGCVYIGIIGLAAITILPNPNNGQNGWYGMFMTMPIYIIALLILIPVIKNQVKGQFQMLALAIVGFIYMGWMFGHAAFLANAPEQLGYILYLFFAVELNDVAAFTCGRIFGKHPFRSNISPKKTWEGALGAFTFSMILPWLMHFSFPHFGTVQLLLTGLIVGAGGQIGDLSISMIKREIGVKDMGASLPGHGGVLDRIDSLIYTAPLYLHVIDYNYKLWW